VSGHTVLSDLMLMSYLRTTTYGELAHKGQAMSTYRIPSKCTD